MSRGLRPAKVNGYGSRGGARALKARGAARPTSEMIAASASTAVATFGRSSGPRGAPDIDITVEKVRHCPQTCAWMPAPSCAA